MTDFNIGNNTCKVAAMQYQLQILLNDPNLVADGKLGTKTMTAMSTFIQKRKMNEKRKGQFLELIKTKKKGLWLRQQVQQMIIKDWKQKFAVLPATALSPNIHNKYYNQQKQSLKTISTIDYISTSVQFFENYYLRINRKYSELTEKK
jgi:peptidoglycan hydrolase-like protein with peptidoglycan-binding domain